MKRVISLCLLTIVSVTSVIPAFAQASKRSSETKTQLGNAQTRFGSLRAYSDGAGVLIQWEMAAEKNNIGFTVSRTDGDGTRLVSKSLISGSAAISGSAITSGEKYSFFDAEGDAQASYSVTSIQANGKTIDSTSVLPEYISDLRSVGSASSQELSRQAADRKSNGSIISNRLELPKTIVKDIETNQLADDPVNHRWVISQPGVKIGVKKEGFYRVTRAELQGAGFNASGDSSLWQLYLAGVQQSIIVGPNNGDYIEFYGTGVDVRESDTRIYYLISGPSAGKRIESRVARPTAGTVTSSSYSQTFLQSERINYLSQVLNGSLQNYWGQPINSLFDTTVNFTLTNVDFASPNATLDVSFEGYSFDAHVVEVKINGQTLATANGNGRGPFSKLYTIPTSFLNEGANSLVFRSMQNATSSFFDTVKVGFARKFGASQNRLSFFTQNYRRANIEGFSTANIRVFDMTAEGSPAQMTNLNVVQNGGTFGITMPAGRGRLLYAVENSGLLQAASLTPNDPTLLATPGGVGDLIIISYKGWMTQAENWANYRRGQGFTVKVIEVSEIYDEFNYGVVNSLSIRNFLQYAASNWQVAPRYVLLLGDASYDARNYEGFGNNNFVPTHMVDTIYLETGSDDTLADFDNDGLAEMAVGRIPARTAQAVTNALAKVTAYELAAQTMASGGVLFASDQYDPANNYDFLATSNRLRSHLPPAVPVTMITRSDTPPPPDTPQTLLISSMNSGKYLVNYTGHGTLGAWVNASFFSSNNVPALTNANKTIFTMLTCLNGYFLHASFKSLAENLLDSTNGGAVAAWASSGETTPDVQEIMATRFFIRISGGSIERLGDLINDAKTTIPGGTDVRLSWALIGDPMLKVRTASTGDRQQ